MRPSVVPLLLLLLSPELGLLPGAQAVKVHVITNVTSPDSIYPELNPDSQFYISNVQQKPSLGIAISGGGWRSAALGYGWLRAMHLVSNICIHLFDGCQVESGCWFTQTVNVTEGLVLLRLFVSVGSGSVLPAGAFSCLLQQYQQR